jgi:hypothetical protein
MAAHDIAAPLLHGGVIVTPVPRVEACASPHAKLETHLRVTHDVALLFGIMSNRDSWKPTRAGLAHRLNHKLHVRRVVDLEMQAGVPTSGLLDEVQDGFHYVTRASLFLSFAASASFREGGPVKAFNEPVWRLKAGAVSP